MMEKEDQILLAVLADKIRQCETQSIPSQSQFLDLRQQSLVAMQCQKQKGLQYAFYGGYKQAERKICVCFPDWLPVQCEVEALDYFSKEQEENPLVVLRVRYHSFRRLSHRDYLGALMNLGVKRELIGDILVTEEGCDIVIFKGIGSYLRQNFTKAGSASLQTEIVSVTEIAAPVEKTAEETCSVSSLRLDTMVSSAFGCSRKTAVEAINSGFVFVNKQQRQKPDLTLQPGDQLVLRGKGKAVLRQVTGQTKKGRLLIVWQKFL